MMRKRQLCKDVEGGGFQVGRTASAQALIQETARCAPKARGTASGWGGAAKGESARTGGKESSPREVTEDLVGHHTDVRFVFNGNW